MRFRLRTLLVVFLLLCIAVWAQTIPRFYGSGIFKNRPLTITAQYGWPYKVVEHTQKVSLEEYGRLEPVETIPPDQGNDLSTPLIYTIFNCVICLGLVLCVAGVFELTARRWAASMCRRIDQRTFVRHHCNSR